MPAAANVRAPRAARADKSAAILAAATTVFLAHGFEAATTDMIQRAAGVSKATLYAIYPTKQALFAAVVAARCAAITERFRAWQPAPGELAAQLRSLGDAYLGLLLSDEGLALHRVLLAEAPRHPALGHLFHAAGPVVVRQVIAGHLARAAEQGRLRLQTVGAERAASLFMSMVAGELQLEALTHPDSRPSQARRDECIELALQAFLTAFGPPGGPAPA